MHYAMELDGILPRVLRELVKVLTKTHHHDQGCPSFLQVSKCGGHIQEQSEGAFREIQACQSDLDAKEGHGADHLEGHHETHAGQPGDLGQAA